MAFHEALIYVDKHYQFFFYFRRPKIFVMKRNLFLLLFAAVALLTSCVDDDNNNNNNGPSEPTGSISANQTLIEGPGTAPVESAWTLPTVSAIRFQGQLSITASNQGTGESLVFLLPDNGEAVYSNNTNDASLGVATWTPASGMNALSSIAPNDPGPTSSMFVQVTTIDTSAKVLSGMFTVLVKNTLDPANYALFEEGVFTDVPYGTEITGEGDVGEGSLTCDVDGEPHVTNTFIATSQSFTNMIIITSASADESTVSLSLPSDVEAGTTLDLGTLTQDYLANYLSADGTAYQAVEGSITITSHDTENNTIQGTFEYGAAQGLLNPAEIQITNGAFEATYTE